MRAIDLPPEILDTMLADLSRECVQYRRSLGDSNCTTGEVLSEAYAHAVKDAGRRAIRDTSIDVLHAGNCASVCGGDGCSCSPIVAIRRQERTP